MGLKIALTLFIALVGIFAFFSLVSAPAVSGISVRQACTRIACVSDGSGVAAAVCGCDNVTANDANYAGGNDGLTSTNNLAEVQSNHSAVDVPNGSTIVKAEVSVDWYVSPDGTCSVSVWNGTWNIVRNTCRTTEGTDTFNITNISTTEALAEDIRVKVNYTRLAGTLYVDFINVTVTYAPPHPFDSWNLLNASDGSIVTDGDNFTRAGAVNASAHWSNVLNSAVVEHNGSGSMVNYSIAGLEGNWTTYTLNFSNYTQFPTAGNVTVATVCATDTYGQENCTSPKHWFFLRGHADVNGLGMPETVLNGTNVSLVCNVTDSNSSAVIGGYNVSFWNNGSYMGSNVTNSSGLALWLFQDSTQPNGTTQSIQFSCTITNSPALYYTASGNMEGTATLHVVDVQMIVLTINGTIYNRGENITISLLDTSNASVAGVVWNISLTTFGQNATRVFDGLADNYTFSINSSDPAGNWTMIVNASKNNHTISQIFSFNVTNNLTVVFTAPASGTSYAANGNIADPVVQVKNARGEFLAYNVTVTLLCPNGKTNLTQNGNNYQNASFQCTAPGTSGTSFTLEATANSTSNNTGFGRLSLVTTSPGSGSSSGGGGGGGGAFPSAANCTCGSWLTFSCGAGNCSSSGVYQTRVCQPAGCAAEAQCVYSPVCAGEIGLNVSLNRDTLQIAQGGDSTVILSITNSGDELLTLAFYADGNCCGISELQPFGLPSGASRDIPLTVHVPLSQESGQYIITVNTTANSTQDTLTATVAFTVTVVNGDFVNTLTELKSQMRQLDAQIQKYQSAGLDTAGLNSQKKRIQNRLAGAFSSIESDSLAGLRENVEQASAELRQAFQNIAEQELMTILFEKRWLILSGILLVFVSTYIVTQVVVPYYQLGRDIGKLVKEEKSLVKIRVETEKQYFKRIIDEKTFRSIVVEGQGKILRVRGALTTKRDARSTLLKSRLRPTGMATWVRGLVTRQMLRRVRNTLVKQRETVQEKRGKSVFRNIMMNFGLAEQSGHPKLRFSARPPKHHKHRKR